MIDSTEAAAAAESGFASAVLTGIDLSGITDPALKEQITSSLTSMKLPEPMKAAFKAFAENLNEQLLAGIPGTFTTNEDGDIIING